MMPADFRTFITSNGWSFSDERQRSARTRYDASKASQGALLRMITADTPNTTDRRYARLCGGSTSEDVTYARAALDAVSKDPSLDLDEFRQSWRPDLGDWELDIHDKHLLGLTVEDPSGTIRGNVSLYNMVEFPSDTPAVTRYYSTMVAPAFDSGPDGNDEDRLTVASSLVARLVQKPLRSLDGLDAVARFTEIRFPQGNAAHRWYHGHTTEPLEAALDGIADVVYVEGVEPGKKWVYLVRPLPKNGNGNS